MQKSSLRLDDSGQVLVAVHNYLERPSGVNVISRNLLHCFDPESYQVATLTSPGRSLPANSEPVASVGWQVNVPSRHLRGLLRLAQVPMMASSLRRLIEENRPETVVAVYPNIYLLDAVLRAVEGTGGPLVGYLYDTIAEQLQGSPLERRARALQQRLFKTSKGLAVISDGMNEFYKHEYGLETKTIEHIYPEPIPETLPRTPFERSAFFGGLVYDINVNSLSRIARSLESLSCPFFLATKSRKRFMSSLDGLSVKTGYFASRASYLENLQKQGLLVLALDWPDESPVHKAELSTIFPTKTPEYLASGRPIMVHCPENYFLARFFREHGCGVVVSERSIESLSDACESLLGSSPEVESMRRSAIETARCFSAGPVAAKFRALVQNALET